MSIAERAFTPAAGRIMPTAWYDRLLAVLTREPRWREAMLQLVAPQPGERILDVGSGTGTFAILLKQASPESAIVGLDPDGTARAIAMQKAKDVGVHVDWVEGFARDASKFGTFDKVVSSLVFHQVPVIEKRAGLAAVFAAVRPGGIVCIADYARQSRWLMRQAFRIVQAADGKADTQPNADGFLELELSRLAGRKVAPKLVVDTPTGTISLFALSSGSDSQPNLGT